MIRRPPSSTLFPYPTLSLPDAMAHAILPGAAVGFLIAGLSLPAMTVGGLVAGVIVAMLAGLVDRKSTRLNSSHAHISDAVFCLKKKKTKVPVQLSCIQSYRR